MTKLVSPRRSSECSTSWRSSGATTTTMPTPMLKVRNISSSATAAALLDQAEEGRHLPGAAADARAQALGQDARDVAGEAAARDVGEGADLLPLEQRLERGEVAAVGREERLAHASVPSSGSARVDAGGPARRRAPCAPGV